MSDYETKTQDSGDVPESGHGWVRVGGRLFLTLHFSCLRSGLAAAERVDANAEDK